MSKEIPEIEVDTLIRVFEKEVRKRTVNKMQDFINNMIVSLVNELEEVYETETVLFTVQAVTNCFEPHSKQINLSAPNGAHAAFFWDDRKHHIPKVGDTFLLYGVQVQPTRGENVD